MIWNAASINFLCTFRIRAFLLHSHFFLFVHFHAVSFFVNVVISNQLCSVAKVLAWYKYPIVEVSFRSNYYTMNSRSLEVFNHEAMLLNKRFVIHSVNWSPRIPQFPRELYRVVFICAGLHAIHAPAYVRATLRYTLRLHGHYTATKARAAGTQPGGGRFFEGHTTLTRRRRARNNSVAFRVPPCSLRWIIHKGMWPKAA